MSVDIENRDYEFYVGTDYVRRLTLEEDGQPVSLKDYTAAMQLRSTLASDVAFELTTENGHRDQRRRRADRSDLPLGRDRRRAAWQVSVRP